MIYDLRRLRVYLFHFHNFQEFIRIDLEDELLRGARSYDMAPLFSRVELSAPNDGASVSAGSVELEWKGRPSSSYQVCLSTSPDPNDSCQHVGPDVAYEDRDGGVLFGILGVFFGLLVRPDRRRRRFWTPCLILAAAGAAACSGDATGPGDVAPELTEMTHTVSGLAPGTTYYWKIIAKPSPSAAFSSETVIYRFTTGG
jgi:hypothetical protein